MQDLNATMFYKAKFTVASKDPTEDLLWKLILELRAWLTAKHNREETIVNADLRKWTRFKLGGKLFDERNSNLFFAHSLYHEDKENSQNVSWACKIMETPTVNEGYAPRQWITEVGYQSHGGGIAEISYVVTYCDQAGFIGELQPAPEISLPRVIRRILNHPDYLCSINGITLSTKPIKLNSGDFPAFEQFIFDVNRTLPIVYISPKRIDSGSDETKLLVSPEDLAYSIAANGLVYYADSLDFSHEMRYLGDERYTCTGGSVRLYLPRADSSNPNDRFRHRFIPAALIESREPSFVPEMFRRALAQDVHYYESMFRLENCQEYIDKETRQFRLAEIKKKFEVEVDEAYEEFIAESERRERIESELEQHKDEISRLKGDIYTLNMQLQTLQKKAQQAYTSDLIRALDKYPDAPAQIVHYFETVFPDRIAFTERAYKSLDDCITRCDILWDALYHIATSLYDAFQSNPAQAYDIFTNSTGWDIARGNGHQTRANAKLMQQYIDMYDGHEIDIEAHVKRGNKDNDPRSVRIYFAYDPQVDDRIIIGHCGRHLENASSRKIK